MRRAAQCRRNPPHFFLLVQKETGWSLKERARQRGLLAPLWKPPARRLEGIELPTIAVTAHPYNLRSRHPARTQAVRALRWRLPRFGCAAPLKPSPRGEGGRPTGGRMRWWYALRCASHCVFPSSVTFGDSFPQRGKPWGNAHRRTAFKKRPLCRGDAFQSS